MTFSRTLIDEGSGAVQTESHVRMFVEYFANCFVEGQREMKITGSTMEKKKG